MIDKLRSELKKLSNPEQAKNLQRFFKTGKGQYGEGDIFLGLKVPVQRTLVGKYYEDLSFNELQALLNSKIHEERLIALLCLVKNYEKKEELRKKIFEFYLKNTRNINNWDLVDLSAPNIVGRFLYDSGEEPKLLDKLVKSKDLWEKRIAILATFYFIRKGELNKTIKLSEELLNDKHDLIHKAVGWMLREVGKKNQDELIRFLKKNYHKMPRTMLRYSIEKFPEEKRKAILKGDLK